MEKQKEPVPMTCDKCGYEWKYKGKLQITTCPSCKRNVKTIYYK